MIDRVGVDVDQAGPEFGVYLCVLYALAYPPHRLVGEQVQAHGLAVRRGLAVAGEVEQVGDQLAELAGLLTRRPHQSRGLRVGEAVAVVEQVEVRGEAGERCAQLVGRVGDELALRGDRFVQRGQHRVEGGTEPAHLVFRHLVFGSV